MESSLVILGDIHVSVRGHASQAFGHIVEHVASLRPRLVVLAGDMTSGNAGDNYPIARVRSWWAGLAQALVPLRQAGIPVLPIAGNHDWYTREHQRGYMDAWADLEHQVGDLVLMGEPPLYYSVRVDGLHLALLHVVDQAIGRNVARWLAGDLAAAADASLRLAVGHVPLSSAISRPNRSFARHLGGILVEGKAACYFAGHEHLVWDQYVHFGARQLRQVIVGTPGSSYNFPLHPGLRKRFCAGQWGFMPATGHAFRMLRGSGRQVHKAAFAVVDIAGSEYRVSLLALDRDNQIVPFVTTEVPEPASMARWREVVWLQQALNALLGLSLDVDGDYGARTRAAVKQFQRRHELEDDGIAGPVTRATLIRELRLAGISA